MGAKCDCALEWRSNSQRLCYINSGLTFSRIFIAYLLYERQCAKCFGQEGVMVRVGTLICKWEKPRWKQAYIGLQSLAHPSLGGWGCSWPFERTENQGLVYLEPATASSLVCSLCIWLLCFHCTQVFSTWIPASHSSAPWLSPLRGLILFFTCRSKKIPGKGKTLPGLIRVRFPPTVTNGMG